MKIPREYVQLSVCIGGIYSCYMTYGVLQEKIYRFEGEDGERFGHTLFLLLVQTMTNASIAFLLTRLWPGPALNSAGKKRFVPLSPFYLSGATVVLAMLCSNEALKHVNYPTQALGKSCKMIPVMLMGVIIRGRRYTLKQYFCVLLITAGIAVFQLGRKWKATDRENSVYGLVLLFLSLTFDGITGPNQEELVQQYEPTSTEMMLMSNIFGVGYLFVACVITGQGWEALLYCMKNTEVVGIIFLLGITSAIGQNFIFYTLRHFEALTCTTITTTRKFFTILMSVVLYGHQLTEIQWMGVFMVFAGLGMDLQSKYIRSKRARDASAKNALADKLSQSTTTITNATENGVIEGKKA